MTTRTERWNDATDPEWRVGYDEFATVQEATEALRSMIVQSPRLRIWYVDRDDSTSHGGIVCITGNGPTSEANAIAIAHARQDIDAAERERDVLRESILDIDAHATGYGIGDDEVVHHYIVSAGAIHRALGVVGHTSPKVDAALDRADAVERVVETARVVSREYWNDNVVVDETDYTNEYLSAAQDLYAALRAYDAARQPADGSGT